MRAVQDVSDMIRQAGRIGKGSHSRMCEHVILLGDFNTRFQFEVPGIIYSHGVDRDFGYYAHKRHVARVESLLQFFRELGLRVASSQFELGFTRHVWKFGPGDSGSKLDHVCVSEGMSVDHLALDKELFGCVDHCDHFPIVGTLTTCVDTSDLAVRCEKAGKHNRISKNANISFEFVKGHLGPQVQRKLTEDKTFLHDFGCLIFSDCLQYQFCLHNVDIFSTLSDGVDLIKHAVRECGVFALSKKSYEFEVDEKLKEVMR
eukprot:10893555-Karenia_brevis.AAC.1